MQNQNLKISIGTTVGLTLFFIGLWLFQQKSGDAHAQAVLVLCSLSVLSLFLMLYSITKIDSWIGPWFKRWIDGARIRTQRK